MDLGNGGTDGNGHGTQPEGTHRLRTKETGTRRVLGSAGFLFDAARRRKGGRIFLWTLVVGLAIGGVVLLTYPMLTDFWAHRRQSGLAKQFTAPSQIQAYRDRRIPVGGALTRLRIPKLGVNVIVVEGISGNALRAGAGHYPDTPLPGELGNVAIAGHRTGFGEPFRHLERMRKGDRIILETPIGRYVYEVTGPFDGHANPWITGPKDWTVLTSGIGAELTLTTCDPPHTSKNRMIVRAALVSPAQSIAA
jgi:sortase A